MSKVLFYIFSLTWGLPLTLVGGVATLFFWVFSGQKPWIYGCCVYTSVGNGCDGLNLGMFCFVGGGADVHTKRHEHGHAVQNCVFGVLTPFLITIPSAIRYWYRYFVRKTKGWEYLKPYDSIWFEAQATAIGETIFERL